MSKHYKWPIYLLKIFLSSSEWKCIIVSMVMRSKPLTKNGHKPYLAAKWRPELKVRNNGTTS